MKLASPQPSAGNVFPGSNAWPGSCGLRVNPATDASGAEFMHGLAQAPRVIDSAGLIEQTASGRVGLLVARRGDDHQTGGRSPMLGARAGGRCTDPIEDQSKAGRSIR